MTSDARSPGGPAGACGNDRIGRVDRRIDAVPTRSRQVSTGSSLIWSDRRCIIEAVAKRQNGFEAGASDRRGLELSNSFEAAAQTIIAEAIAGGGHGKAP